MDVADPQAAPGAKPGKKRCGAKLRNKPGKRCRNDKLMPNGRCRLHGGLTPEGMASPNWKHGRDSKHRWQGSLPADTLGKRFDAALADPTLASLRQALALNDALITSFTANLKNTGRPVTPLQEKRILTLLNSQRMLAGDEARRLRDLAVMITETQFAVVINTVIQLFNDYVTDPKAKLEVHRRLQQALVASRRPAIEGGDE